MVLGISINFIFLSIGMYFSIKMLNCISTLNVVNVVDCK